jgi:hypothetical protein
MQQWYHYISYSRIQQTTDTVLPVTSTIAVISKKIVDFLYAGDIVNAFDSLQSNEQKIIFPVQRIFW